MSKITYKSDKDFIEITIPMTPVPKGRPRFSRKTGRTYTPKATQKATDDIAFIIKKVLAVLQTPPQFGEADALGFRALYTFERPKSYKNHSFRTWKITKPDKDNLDKLLMDAISKSGLWIDDNRVADSDSKKILGATGEQPSIYFKVWRLEPYYKQGEG